MNYNNNTNKGKKIRSYTAGEKLMILSNAERTSNRAAARMFDVAESYISDWKNN